MAGCLLVVGTHNFFNPLLPGTHTLRLSLLLNSVCIVGSIDLIIQSENQNHKHILQTVENRK